MNEFNNNNNKIFNTNKTKKQQYEISHIDSNNVNIINKKESEIIIKYSNLQIAKGFPSFSVVDKKRKFKYKKIDINRKKDSKEKNIKNKNKTNKNKIIKKKIFPNEEKK